MGADSRIEWTRHTFNAWIGCSKVSAGCTHCYAESLAKRTGLTVWGNQGTRHVTSDAYWRQPYKWAKAAAALGERHRVFCNSLADVFEDRPELAWPRHRLWQVILDTRHALDWLLLTKRPEHLDMVPLSLADSIWLGVSVEDRKNKARIDLLRERPAALRFLSLEPLLEDLGELDLTGISWCIIGGESGPGARRCDVDWIRKIVWQCQAASIPVFVKQLGAHVIENGERRIKRDKKGGDMDEWAHDIRVREWPEAPNAKECGDGR